MIMTRPIRSFGQLENTSKHQCALSTNKQIESVASYHGHSHFMLTFAHSDDSSHSS